MKTFLARIIAFILDMVLISLIVTGVSLISFINPNNGKINDYYQKMDFLTKEYKSIPTYLDEVYADQFFSQNEINKLIETHPDFISVFQSFEVDKIIDDEKEKEVTKAIEKVYLKKSNEYNYNIMKLNISISMITIILYIGYFGVLQYFMKGQTLFKKLFRIKVISTNDSEPSLINYLIRSLLVTGAIFSIINLICLLVLKIGPYITVYYYMDKIQYFYNLLFIVILIFKDDGKSIHDILLKTKVVRISKNSKIIDEAIFNEEKVS